MPDELHPAREVARWLIERWRALLIMLLLAPVLGPGLALFCFAAGAYALFRSRSPKAAQAISLGEKLDALIAAVLPAAIYGCTLWGLQVLIKPSGWTGWIPISLLAGLVTLAVGLLSALYIFGYSLGVAQADAEPPSAFRAANPTMSLSGQMLRPFRHRRPP